MESKKFLSVEEVAAEFGLDAAALKEFVDAGEVRALADRGTWKYRRDELQALVDAGRFAPPSGELSSGDATDSNAHILTLGEPADDDLSYIELDEDALAERATIISKSSPVSSTGPVEEESSVEDWFVPSDEAEMKAPVAATEQSSSDVAIYSGPEVDEGSAIDETESVPAASAADSDSDVRLADFAAPRPEDSGIMLDFNLDAGATVSSSGSSLRLPRTAADTIPDAEVAQSDASSSDVEVWNPTEESPVLGGSGIGLVDDEDISLEIGDEDSGVRLAGGEESGILLDEGSTIGMPEQNDSGIALDSGASGISLEEDDGITLAQDDSGISLVNADSGLSLEAGDSGLSFAEDSGISIAGNAKTLADDDLDATVMFDDDDSDKTRTLGATGELDDDSGFDMDLSDSAATAEILFDDEDSDDISATVVKKGRKSKPEPGSLSAAFELDEPAEVEDLEISGDLDAGEDDEVEEFAAEEEVFDASEETFSGDEVEATEDEDYLEPAAKKTPTGPREPAWGAGMVVGLVACSLFLAANVLVVWGGVSTMWNGAEAQGPAASLIASLAGLIG
jgi:hypothetical protein